MEDSFFPVTSPCNLDSEPEKVCWTYSHVAIQQVFLVLNIDNNNKETNKQKKKNSNIVNWCPIMMSQIWHQLSGIDISYQPEMMMLLTRYTWTQQLDKN